LPAVSVGEDVIASNMSSVDVDNYGASKAATEHLIKLGHSRIAILTGRHSGDGWARMRYAGYVDALRQAGIPARRGAGGRRLGARVRRRI